jgi:tetratricopeptide (TPR) repeat protein
MVTRKRALIFLVCFILLLTTTGVWLNAQRVQFSSAENMDWDSTQPGTNLFASFSSKPGLEEKAREAFAAGQWELAIEYFGQVDSLSEMDLILLGKAYDQLGRLAQAIQVWQSAVVRQSASEESFQLYAEGLIITGSYSEALDWLAAGLSRYPDSTQLRADFLCLQAIISPQEAVNTYHSWQQKPTAQILLLNSFIQAVEEAGNETDPTYRKILLGRALGREGQWGLAEKAFLEAVETAPDYAEAWAFLGEAQLQLGKDGWLSLNRAEQLNPNAPVVLSLISYHWRLLGQPKEALPYIQRLVELEPDEPVWHIELAEVLTEIGYLSEALVHYQTAVVLAPEQSQWWQLLAGFCVYYDIDVRGIALPAARQVLRLESQSAESQDLMGLVLLKLGDIYTSERFLQSALQKDPDYAKAHLHLGQLYLFDGKMELAEAHLSKAISLTAPDSDIHGLAVRLLEYNFPK